MWCSAMLLVRMVSNPEGGSPRLASRSTSPYLADRMLRSSIVDFPVSGESRLGEMKVGVGSGLPGTAMMAGGELSTLFVHVRMTARAHTVSAVAIQCLIDPLS